VNPLPHGVADLAALLEANGWTVLPEVDAHLDHEALWVRSPQGVVLILRIEAWN
jgi:hypothetical protein